MTSEVNQHHANAMLFVCVVLLAQVMGNDQP